MSWPLHRSHNKSLIRDLDLVLRRLLLAENAKYALLSRVRQLMFHGVRTIHGQTLTETSYLIIGHDRYERSLYPTLQE